MSSIYYDFISVIIPFHKEINKLCEAVHSVYCQHTDFLPVTFEVVISNDSIHSVEEISSAISSLTGARYPFIVVNNKYKRGPGGNRNSAIEASSGDWIAFLDSDDTWHPLKIYFQYHLLQNGCNFVATGFSYAEESVIVKPPNKLNGFKSIFSIFL